MELTSKQNDSIRDYSDTYHFLVRGFEIEDKNLEDWAEEFTISIPNNPDILTLKSLISVLAEKIQICADRYSQANFVIAYMDNANDAELKSRKSEILKAGQVKHDNRAESIAKGDMAGKILSYQVGVTIKDFFQEQLKKLKSVANQLETLANLTMSEMRNINRMIPGA